jgi:xylose isomerase
MAFIIMMPKVVMGKPMKDWLKFAMAWWHTLGAQGTDQFGGDTKQFLGTVSPMPYQAAKNKVDAGFEIHAEDRHRVFLFPRR